MLDLHFLHVLSCDVADVLGFIFYSNVIRCLVLKVVRFMGWEMLGQHSACYESSRPSVWISTAVWLGVAVCTCNPSTEEAERMIPGALWPALLALSVSSRFNVHTCVCTHMHACTRIYTHTHRGMDRHTHTDTYICRK